MNLSIIIPDHNDLSISNLIESIDYINNSEHQVELVIVLNQPTVELKKTVQIIKEKFCNNFHFRIININKCNLGLAYNAGIKNASYEYVLFLDSDLICTKGAISMMVQAMQEGGYEIIKGKVLFNKGENSSYLVSNVRYVTTTDTVSPYIPVILMNKDIFKLLNDGYMFAVDTVWCSDSDFASRVMRKKLPINYLDAFFSHPSISLKKDLKDAFFYGLGKGIRTKRTKEKWNPIKELADMVTLGKKASLSIWENSYLFLWELLLQFGCLLQLITPNNFILKNTVDFKFSNGENTYDE